MNPSTLAETLPFFVPFGKPFQDLFGPGRSTQAELIRDGKIRSVLVGEKRGRRMIETASYLEYLERQRRREAAGEIGMASPNPRARQRDAAADPSRAASRKNAAPRTIERPQGGAPARQQYRARGSD